MYTRNCLIGSVNFRGFLLSLGKDVDKIIGEVRTKTTGGVPFVVVGKTHNYTVLEKE